MSVVKLKHAANLVAATEEFIQKKIQALKMIFSYYCHVFSIYQAPAQISDSIWAAVSVLISWIFE